ncbi:MAG: ABC transporter ATP-binding protein [Candidatus Nitricoxidivorans perseverans]|uniref:ABC transporter ATP-binding protein n=1 Tax=Candidatus Nitricoxidivorans perseverans TaxID=2975601 RepID=A0AA49FLQ6_9PROT|nr:MAG: ABC transporter ATP-binding protein [Candidatus Nitricoxidivorans perseverans]
MTLLSVSDLTVAIGATRPVDGVSFDIAEGETFALLGESGCGKSMTALALMRLLPEAARVAGGSVAFDGRDLLALPEARMREVRGGGMAMIFQEPATSLNPVMTIGRQIAEAQAAHGREDDPAALLEAVGIPDPQRRLGEFPFQLSGGMKQRAMIAMALAGRPRLLIADEPTTALDVTIQAQVLDLLARLQSERGMAMLLITHDFGVAARMADRVGVMHAGRLVEVAAKEAFYRGPAQPYSKKLFAALPENLPRAPVTEARDRPQLEVEGLAVHFPIRRGLLQRTVGHVRAVDGVSLEVGAGGTLALVGESGCGKTTVGKAILGLIPPTAGGARFDGEPLSGLSAGRMQMVFQDTYGSLNPRMRIGDTLAEGMRALKVPGDAAGLLEQVGLSRDMAGRWPHEFSGGQRQRIAIARALAVRPRLLILDEPTSALDVSVQAHILALLRDLQARLGLAYLFITHNIAVVDYLARKVAVMYLGRIVERGTADEVLRGAKHPYTQALMAAVPRIDGLIGEKLLVPGDPPSPANPPTGCHFHPRCPQAMGICRHEYPAETGLSATHRLHCHLFATSSS